MRTDILFILTVHVKRPDETAGIGLHQQKFFPGLKEDAEQLSTRYGHAPNPSALGSFFSKVKSGIGLSSSNKPYKVFVNHHWFGVDGESGNSMIEVPEDFIRRSDDHPDVIAKLPVNDQYKQEIEKRIGKSKDVGAYVICHFVETTGLISNAIPMDVLGEYLGELGLHASRKINITACNLARQKLGENRLIAIGNGIRKFCNGKPGPMLASYSHVVEIDVLKSIEEGKVKELVKKFFDKDRDDNLYPKEDMAGLTYKVVAKDSPTGYVKGSLEEWTDKVSIPESPEAVLEKRRKAVKDDLETLQKSMKDHLTKLETLLKRSAEPPPALVKEVEDLTTDIDALGKHIENTAQSDDAALAAIKDFIAAQKKNFPLVRRRSADLGKQEWFKETEETLSRQSGRLSDLSFPPGADHDRWDQAKKEVKKLQEGLQELNSLVSGWELGSRMQRIQENNELKGKLTTLDSSIKKVEQEIKTLEAALLTRYQAEQQRSQTQTDLSQQLPQQIRFLTRQIAVLDSLTILQADGDPHRQTLRAQLTAERAMVVGYVRRLQQSAQDVAALGPMEQYLTRARSGENPQNRQYHLETQAQLRREIKRHFDELKQLGKRFNQATSLLPNPLPPHLTALAGERVAINTLMAGQANRLQQMYLLLAQARTPDEVRDLVQENTNLRQDRVAYRITRFELHFQLQEQLVELTRQSNNLDGVTGDIQRPRDRRALRTQITNEIREVRRYIQQTDPTQPLNAAAFPAMTELLQNRNARNLARDENIEILSLQSRQQPLVRQYNQLHQRATRLRDHLQGLPQPLDRQQATILNALNARFIPTLEQERKALVDIPATLLNQFPLQQPDANANMRRQVQDQSLNQTHADLNLHQQMLTRMQWIAAVGQQLQQQGAVLNALQQRLNALTTLAESQDRELGPIAQAINGEQRQLDQDYRRFQQSTNDNVIQTINDRWTPAARNTRNLEIERLLAPQEVRNDIMEVTGQLALVQDAQQIQNRPDLRGADMRRMEHTLNNQLDQLYQAQQALNDPRLTQAEIDEVAGIASQLVTQLRGERAPISPRLNALEADVREWRLLTEYQQELRAVQNMQTTLTGLGALTGAHGMRQTTLQAALTPYQTQLRTNQQRLQNGQPLQPQELQTMENYLERMRGQRLQRRVDTLAQDVHAADLASHNQFMTTTPAVPPAGGIPHMHVRAATPAQEAAAIDALANTGGIPVIPLPQGMTIGRNPAAGPPHVTPGAPAVPYGGQALYLGLAPDRTTMRYAIYDAEGVRPRVYSVAHWLQGDSQRITQQLRRAPVQGDLVGQVTAKQPPSLERFAHKFTKTFGL